MEKRKMRNVLYREADLLSRLSFLTQMPEAGLRERKKMKKIIKEINFLHGKKDTEKKMVSNL